MSDSHTSLALIPQSFGEVNSLAETLSKSALLPKALVGKVPEVMMTIMAGAELGLPPIAALRSIHVIEGKTVLSADVMVAVAISKGAAVYVKRISADENHATYETLRRGETTPQRMTWTWEMAKAAGLNTKDNWRLFRRQMLASRTKSELMRDVYPDVLAGCYTHEELDVDVRQSPRNDIIDVEIVEPKAPIATVEQSTTAPVDATVDQRAADLVARLYAATTEVAVVAMRAECDNFPRGTTARKTVAAAFKTQLEKAKMNDALAAAQPVVVDAEIVEPTTEAVAS